MDMVHDSSSRDPESPPQEPELSLWLAKILHSRESFLCSVRPDLEVEIGSLFMIPTKYGIDLAEALGKIKVQNNDLWDETVEVVRMGSAHDLELFHSNEARETEARDLCRQKIEQHGLDMKLVSVHYLLEEPKIIFFFTSENRVDFRDLVKDLVGVFHQRIELRQIGVRDESRLVGGKGVCGRGLCCNVVSDRLQPVSIKMAKVQNLSLNSMKISGPCGRLLCCLAYEYDAYKAERKDLPQEGASFRIDGCTYSVQGLNVLSRIVYLHGEENRTIGVPAKFFSVDSKGFWRFNQPSLAGIETFEALAQGLE